LEEGFIDALIGDANEFLDGEDWYIEAGIPHRRGYLLYGPPGTGKTSTVYAVAGELGLEIYSLSLASNLSVSSISDPYLDSLEHDSIDDPFLQRAVSSIPKHSLLLIEDIDCAFPSREEVEEREEQRTQLYNGLSPPPFMMPHQSKVTLSGLLNMIDGVNSEDGKLFFATTNHIDRLDPALLRPGRIDKKIQYKMATKKQAWALYRRFFPESRFADVVAKAEGGDTITHCQGPPTTNHEKLFNDSERSFNADGTLSRLSELADQFAEFIPDDEFSTAELQGYLLMCKMKPLDAVSGIAEWIEQERTEKRERAEREEKRKEKLMESRLKAKTAMVAELVGPLQQQAASGDASTSAPPGTSSNSTRDPITSPQAVRPVAAQFQHNPGVVSSPKINGVNTSDL